MAEELIKLCVCVGGELTPPPSSHIVSSCLKQGFTWLSVFFLKQYDIPAPTSILALNHKPDIAMELHSTLCKGQLEERGVPAPQLRLGIPCCDLPFSAAPVSGGRRKKNKI